MNFTGLTILVGGRSTEHDASLHSYKNLRTQMISAEVAADRTVLVDRTGAARIFEGTPDVEVLLHGSGRPLRAGELITVLTRSSHVFSLLHGTEGEDGAWQGVAEVFNVRGSFGPTGAAAITMDKRVCSAVVAEIESRVRIPRTFVIPTDAPEQAAEAACESLSGIACVVKPNSMGASLLTAYVDNPTRDTLCSLAVEARPYERRMLVQEYVQGVEYTVGVMEHIGGLFVLPPARAAVDGDILGFAEKHRAGSKVSVSWPDPTEGVAKILVDVSESLFVGLGLRLWARFDFIVDESTGEIIFLECNSMPGLGEGSIFPLMLQRNGYSLLDLIDSSIALQRKTPARNKTLPYRIEAHRVTST